VAAVVTPYAGETVGQDATAEVAAEFPIDEGRQAAGVFGALDEGGEMGSEALTQRGLRRLAGGVDRHIEDVGQRTGMLRRKITG